MTQDEIIEMARQAGWDDWEIVCMKGELKTFAKLVADAAVAKAVECKREACAKVVESFGKYESDIAEAIRARGEA